MTTTDESRITFSTHQISVALGVTKRQLHWWVKQELISLTKYGRVRVWTFSDAMRAGVIAQLSNLGMWKHRLRTVLEAAQLREAKERFIVIDNECRAYRAATSEAAIAVMLRLTTNGRMGAMIDRAEIAQKLNRAAADSAEADSFVLPGEYLPASGAAGPRYAFAGYAK